MRCRDGGDALFDRGSSWVASPRDPCATEVAMRRLPKPLAGITGRLRRTRLGPRDHTEQQRHVLDGPRHGALHTEADPHALARPRGDAAERWAETDDVAEARRIAE